MKKIYLLIAVAAMLLLTTTAFAQQTSIGLVLSTLNNPFFVTLKEGAEAEAAKQGFTLVILDSQNDSARELANVEDLIVKKVKVILINPADSDAVGNAIRAANRKKIPVITLDRSATRGKVVTHIASDNVAGGKLAGNLIKELLNGSGNVVELEGIPGTSAARDRGKGFNQALVGSAINVVARQPADFDRAKGLSVMENILQGNADIAAVFAHNDEMALGALRAIEAAQRDIIIVGFDAVDDAVKAVNAGKLRATVAQQPAKIGELGVKAAVDHLKRKKLPKFIPVDLALVQ